MHLELVVHKEALLSCCASALTGSSIDPCFYKLPITCLKSESARHMVSLPSIWHSFCSATVVPQCQHLALTKCSKLSFSQSPLHNRVSLPAWPPYGLSHCQAMQGSLSMMRSFTS